MFSLFADRSPTRCTLHCTALIAVLHRRCASIAISVFDLGSSDYQESAQSLFRVNSFLSSSTSSSWMVAWVLVGNSPSSSPFSFLVIFSSDQWLNELIRPTCFAKAKDWQQFCRRNQLVLLLPSHVMTIWLNNPMENEPENSFRATCRACRCEWNENGVKIVVILKRKKSPKIDS